MRRPRDNKVHTARQSSLYMLHFIYKVHQVILVTVLLLAQTRRGRRSRSSGSRHGSIRSLTMRNVTCAAWITAAIRRALVVGSRVRVLLDLNLRAPMQRSASLGDMEQFFKFIGEADLAHAARV